MAALQKLEVCGIRSFSPKTPEVIEIYSPLTMIVGSNGCGKTSIIEALKYSCTGSLPPTCSNGQSFVNDPTMTDATEVKGSVKLRFTNKAGKNTEFYSILIFTVLYCSTLLYVILYRAAVSINYSPTTH